MTAWVNRAVYQLPRIAATTHTVDPTSSTNLVSGVAFTPTAGRLLVVIIEGAVTSTTPAGWTLPPLGSQINATGLYVWYRTAVSGSNAFTTTHNAANYPVVVAIYEFPVGSTFVKSNNGQPSATGAQPILDTLTGTNLVMSVKAIGLGGGSSTEYIWSGGGNPLEDWDLTQPNLVTDGYSASLGYSENYAGSTWQPTATAGVAGSFEALSFAIKVGTPVAPTWTAALGAKPVTLALGAKAVTGILGG